MVPKLTDTVLRSLSAELDALYADSGRPSIAPEYILRALLLQVFFSIRSERLLVEQIDYNLLFRWFVGLGMDDAVWNHAVFSKNRNRLLTSDVAQRFFAEVICAGFKPMNRKSVSKRMRRNWLADAGNLSNLLASPPYRECADVLSGDVAGKKPVAGFIHSSPCAQGLQQHQREHYLTILLAFALIDTNALLLVFEASWGRE